HAVRAVEVQKIVRLEQHVAELRVADALLAVLQALAHAVLLDHHIDREVLAYVAQHLDVRELLEPVRVVDEHRTVAAAEIEDPLEDAAHAGHVPLHVGAVADRALGVLSRRIADQARAAPDERVRAMAREPVPAQKKERNQVPDRERVARRIEAAVDRARARREVLGEALAVGDLVEEPATLELAEEISAGHERSVYPT